MSTAEPARTNRSGRASPAMRFANRPPEPEREDRPTPRRARAERGPATKQHPTAVDRTAVARRALGGSKPESTIVPRGARRSEQKAHPSRLEQACRFLRSWSCEFDSRHPLQQRNAWSGASLPCAMRLYHGNRGVPLVLVARDCAMRPREFAASQSLDIAPSSVIQHWLVQAAACTALTAHAEDHLPPLSPSSQGKRNFDRTERVEQAIRASQLQIEPSP
jgi:hypothetical protein